MIDATDAAQALADAGLMDPHGQHTPRSLANSGQAFRLTTAGGSGVFIVEKRGNHLWIHGAGAVKTTGLTADGLALIESMGVQSGCEYVAFETARPGLTSIAKKKGYRVSAVVMKKKVTP